MLLFAIAPIFIANLYGRTLTVPDLVMIGTLAALLGPTTAGMSGFLIVAQTGIICGYLGLPFDAAFALFIAVEAVTDTIRTLLQIVVTTGTAAAIAPLGEEEADVVA
ncbi:Sodium:dicarboxylate symporter family protein [Methylobrevis pamukkalensis]|uniref:Sodium:dicarboxylate symporter family protein n=1 Tax=Methylobrevis pamukkalensis TaxID=1439726 RepID=A0A1E3H1J8_9HYPH|nr:Sodium:dicarboxylate symporter family protein [Methylobrevis pamukkalensis]